MSFGPVSYTHLDVYKRQHRLGKNRNQEEKTMADNKMVLLVLKRIGEKIEAEKEYLTELDQPIGDSDHGINLARGFQEVERCV